MSTVSSHVLGQLSGPWLALTSMVSSHVVDSSQVHGQFSHLWLALISVVSFHVHGQLSPVVSSHVAVSSCSWSVLMSTVALMSANNPSV